MHSFCYGGGALQMIWAALGLGCLTFAEGQEAAEAAKNIWFANSEKQSKAVTGPAGRHRAHISFLWKRCNKV